MATRSLILLPGLDGTGILFRPLLAALPSSVEARVVAYPCDVPASYETTLLWVLEALPRGAPFVLLGESYSGPLALMAAARRPPGLEALVLCATFVRRPRTFLGSPTKSLVRPYLFRLFPWYSKAKALLGAYSTPALRELARESLSRVRPEVLAERVRSVLGVNVEAELRCCDLPILYLRGARDRVVPAKNLRRILRLRPSVETVALPAPHLVLQTVPDLAARAIVDFLDRLDRGEPLPQA